MPSVPIEQSPINNVDKDLEFIYPSEESRRDVAEFESREPGKGTAETAEVLARLREETDAGLKPYRWEAQEELLGVRLGKTIQDWEFLRRLNHIVGARFSGLSRHGMWGLEVLFPTERGGEWRHVCGAQSGQMPEYSTMYFDAHNLPSSEMYRGWRTVLLRLISGGAITEEQANKEFGRAEGPESRRYRQQLYAMRNGG